MVVMIIALEYLKLIELVEPDFVKPQIHL